jgi:peptidoglycan/xylan/chitin deacetylase (PgdA/CDA1 family)
MKNGKFILSLDFELHWGVSDIWKLEDRLDYFDTTRQSIPLVLDLFRAYNIHATWATVGYLFAKDKSQLLSFFPEELPSYVNQKLSNYTLFDQNNIGLNEVDDPYHFAPSLIDLILKTPNQELGTHTFSHFYCNEDGQTVRQFDLDLQAAQKLAQKNFGITLQSLVFPRNQFNSKYLEVVQQNGIKVVRSNPDVWFWKNTSKWIFLARAIDTLFPVSKSLTFKHTKVKKDSILMLPASRFLRPFTKKERIIQVRKVNRIKNEMTTAARNGTCYHLWWHPHNFGFSLEQNMGMLIEIIQHFKELEVRFGFESKSMIEMYK